MQSLQNGTRLGGYSIVRLIERGGMGEVYEAHEARLDRRVAIKVIAASETEMQEQLNLVARFLDEARTLAKVNHPNIVTIHAVDDGSAVPFIVMEYVEGASLRDLLRKGRLSLEKAVPLFEQVLNGLRSLHDYGILHRDLKPHNILVREDGQVKILDFGIAKHSDTAETTEAGVIMGSPPYMAPELRKGAKATRRSDFWSVGAIFFECLTGKPLIQSVGPDNEVRFSRGELKRIPEDLRKIIGTLCAPSPDDRYATATHAIDDLLLLRISMHSTGTTGGSLVSEFTPTTHRNEISRPRSTAQTLLLRAGIVVVMGCVLALLLRKVGHSNSDLPASRVAPRSASPGALAAEALQLEEPADGAILGLQPAELPTLTWSRVVQPDEFEIQIAIDKRFQRILFNERVLGNFFQSERALAEGTYYWRLLPVTKSKIPPPAPRSFTVVWLEPIKLAKPLANAVFESSAKTGATVGFAWTCKPGLDQYIFQIAEDNDFAKPTIQSTVSGCTMAQSRLEAGQYYWRVGLASDQFGLYLWSDPRSLTIKSQLKIPLRVPSQVGPPPLPPKLIEANQVVQLSLRNRPRDLASLRDSVVNPPLLTWKPVPGVHHYLVQIADSRDFSTILMEESTSHTSLKWRTIVPGTAFWRVRALSARGDSGKFSAAGKIRALLPPPQLNSNYKFTRASLKGKLAHVSWAASPLASNYLVQLSPRRDLAGADERQSHEAKAYIGKDPGHYYLRVAAANDSFAAISPYSNVAAVEIQATHEEKPKLLTPAKGAQAPSKNGTISIDFSWTGGPSAESYTLVLTSDAAGKDVINQRSTNTRSLLLEHAALKGRVYWRIKANGTPNGTVWSESAYFDVK